MTQTAKIQTHVEKRAEELLPIEKAITSVHVHDDASYSKADALLSEAAREHAELTALRKEATGPAYKSIRTVEGWFRPALQSLDRCIAHLKAQLGEYRVALEERERASRDAALKAAQAGEHGAMSAALEAASDAGAKPPGKSTATFGWEVDRVEYDLVPREYLTIDWSKIKLAIKDAGENPPVIPGIIFKRTARIGARK